MQEFDLSFPEGSFNAIPHLDQWLGLWCIEPNALQSLVASLSILDLRQHLEIQAASAGDARPLGNRMDSEGVAIIKISGVLQKHQSSFGSPGSSTVLARRAIRQAVDDSSIGSILLAIESPGGTSAGTRELFDEVVSAGQSKPLFAHVTDLGASAAYWIASGAEHISVNEAGRVGSIGTFAVVEDFSGQAAQKGIKVHVVRAGEFKGMGVPGTEITAEHLQEIQRHVNSANSMFLEGVSKGRKMSLADVTAIADGRVHFSSQAKTMGLVDAVSTFEEAFDKARLVAVSRLPSKKKGSRMSDSTPVAATSQELRAACPGATPQFILDCLDNSQPVEQAARAWSQKLASENATLGEKCVNLEAQMADLQKANTELEAKNATLAKELEEAQAISPKIGTKALKETGKSDAGFANASEEYWSLVSELQLSSNVTRGEAMAKVNKLKPALREAMSAEANAKTR